MLCSKVGEGGADGEDLIVELAKTRGGIGTRSGGNDPPSGSFQDASRRDYSCLIGMCAARIVSTPAAADAITPFPRLSLPSSATRRSVASGGWLRLLGPMGSRGAVGGGSYPRSHL